MSLTSDTLRKKDYFWNTLGALLQNAISPALLLVVTRVNGIEAAGLFSFAFSVSVLMWAVAMWGGRTYQVSDVKNEFSSQGYIIVRVVLAIFVLIITAVFCLLNNYDAFKTSLIFALVIFKIVESFSDVFYGVIQKNNKLYKSGKSLTAKATIGFLVFVTIDYLTHDILLAVAGMIIINGIIFVAYDLVQANKLEIIKFPKSELTKGIDESKKILRKTIGVFAILFMAMFSLNIPRYFIDMYDQEMVGYFGIMAMPITLIVLLISFILQPNVLKLSYLYNEDKMDKFKKATNSLIKVSMFIGLFVLLGTILLGVQILSLLFGVDFHPYRIDLIIIVLGGIASALVTVYLNIFVIMRRIRFPLLVLIVTNVLLIPVSYFMVEFYGLLGGISAFAIASILQFTIIDINFKRNKVKDEEKN